MFFLQTTIQNVPNRFLPLLVLLAGLALVSAPAAHAAVRTCDEAGLDAAIAAGGTNTFSCGSATTVTVTAGKIVSVSDTVLDGGGLLTISGGNAWRVFVVNPGVTATFQNLTIANGFTTYNGAGLYNDGGTVTISHSTFSGNNAWESGGAIINANDSTLIISDSTFSGNATNNRGGAIINFLGPLTISNSTFSGNNATNPGGAIVNGIGTVMIDNSTFSDNSSTSVGGGIHNLNGALTISKSTFSGNSAASGGGIYNDGGIGTISNSTFSGNSATFRFGGIYINPGFGATTISNSTISGNSAGLPAGGIGGKATLKNTIVANSTSGNCVGTITAGADSMADDATCGSATQKTLAQINLGALTGSPAYFPLNTGSSAIDAGDNAACASAPVSNASQNGVTRPADGNADGTAICDIGAYEAPGSSLATLAGIPTLSEWGMLLLIGLMALLGMAAVRRQSPG